MSGRVSLLYRTLRARAFATRPESHARRAQSCAATLRARNLYRGSRTGIDRAASSVLSVLAQIAPDGYTSSVRRRLRARRGPAQSEEIGVASALREIKVRRAMRKAVVRIARVASLFT